MGDGKDDQESLVSKRSRNDVGDAYVDEVVCFRFSVLDLVREGWIDMFLLRKERASTKRRTKYDSNVAPRATR
jgi:hypothetical protein